MTLHQLRVFVAVAEREHLTRAAEALRVAPSAVSASVSALEIEYGLSLFVRAGRGLRLTPHGTVMLEEARGVLARADEARARLATLLPGSGAVDVGPSVARRAWARTRHERSMHATALDGRARPRQIVAVPRPSRWLRESMSSPQPNLDPGGDFGWCFWCLVPATGAAAGLSAGLLMQLLHRVQALAWGTGAADFQAAVTAAHPLHRVLALALAGLVAAAGGLALRRGRIRAGPAGGGHSGELSAAIWFRGGRLPFLRTLAQGVLSITIVGLGASLGREAAPKQAGAAFGSLFARGLGLSPSHTRILAALGAGAGIAAVYEVPLGGALFALEVLLGSLALPLVAPALLASGLATATAWLLLPERATYAIPAESVSPSLIAFALLVGPLAGLAAAAYVRLIGFADARRPTGVAALVAPVLGLARVGALATGLPQILGNGKDLAEQLFTGGLAWPLLAALVLAKPLATALCLGCGAPGGLFTPTISFGAVLGGLAAYVFSRAVPGVPPGACALVAATAVLAAATQGPVSAVVLMLELTRRLDAMMVPVLLAVAGAMLVARFLEPRSLYACRIREIDRAAQLGSPAISVAAPYVAVLRALPVDGRPLRVFDEAGACLGHVNADRVRAPSRADGPLATATAGDFVVPGGRAP